MLTHSTAPLLVLQDLAPEFELGAVCDWRARDRAVGLVAVAEGRRDHDHPATTRLHAGDPLGEAGHHAVQREAG